MARHLLPLSILAALFVAQSCARPPDKPVHLVRFLLDAPCSIHIPQGDEAAWRAAEAACARMEAVGAALNIHEGSSPLRAFNQAGTPMTDPEVVGVVGRCMELAAQSGGAFDPTIGPLMEAWGLYKALSPRMPTPQELRTAQNKTGWGKVSLVRGTLSKRDPRVRLDLGGAAKGYALAEAVCVLKANGVRHALIDAGGAIYALGRKQGKPWRVGIQDPRGDGVVEQLEVEDCSVSTSGDYQRFFITNGVRYHHLMDPATGRPAASGLWSATVIHPDALLADLLSTAVFVRGRERGLALVAKTSGARAVLVTSTGKVVRSW